MILRIKKGNHYSNKILPSFRINTISGHLRFNGDFSYEIDRINQLDTNKVIGLSDSYHHHRNSIRIGWRWNKRVDKIEILYTVYRNSIRYIESICFIDSDRFYDFEISIIKGKYLLWFNDIYIEVYRSSNWILPRYVLFPFFGGNISAPKEFKFDIVVK